MSTETGNEHDLYKEVELQVDWYETPKAVIPKTYAGGKDNLTQNHNLEKTIDEENGLLKLEFSLAIQEKDCLQILQKAYLEGTIPDLNGQMPLDVTISGQNVEYTYDKNTGAFTAQREATLKEDGTIDFTAQSGYYEKDRYNVFDFVVTYDIEAYRAMDLDTVSLNIPLRAKYYAYNTTQEGFDNPVESNVAEAVLTNDPSTIKVNLYHLAYKILKEINPELAMKHAELFYAIKLENDSQIPDEIEELLIDEDNLDKSGLESELKDYWLQYKFKDQELKYGTVTKIFEHGKAGFITSDDDESVYFNVSEYEGDSISVGQYVSFFTQESFDKSKNRKSTRAVNIRSEF